MANTKPSKDNGMDRLKSLVSLPEPSLDLRDRILMDAGDVLKPGLIKILWPFGPLWKPAGVLAGAMAFGIVLGFVALPADTTVINNEIETIVLG